MANSSVVDANVLKNFHEERVSNITSKYSEVVLAVLDKGNIAIDDEKMAWQEYFDCCQPSSVGLSLIDWISDQIVSGVIFMVKMDKSTKKKLATFGLPSKDQKWVFIAVGSNSDAIITDDIDLFDPKAKSYKSEKKQKIKNSGSGVVAKYLKKHHKISVLCPDAVIQDGIYVND